MPPSQRGRLKRKNSAMGDLSKHFSAREFACHCGCGASRVAPALVNLLEQIREHFGQRVTVVSGRRCPAHNARVGGATSSQHLVGTAADIKVQGVTPKAVADFLAERYPKALGIGRYATWTHVDTRLGCARWGRN